MSMKQTVMNISLPEELKNNAKVFAKEAGYKTTSHLVQDLLQREISRENKRAELKLLLDQGMASGISKTPPKDFLNSLRHQIKSV